MHKLFSMLKNRLKTHHQRHVYDSQNHHNHHHHSLSPQPHCKEIQTEWEAWVKSLKQTSSSSTSSSSPQEWSTAGINIFGHQPTKPRTPLADLCINRSEVDFKKVQIGDMELGGMNADKVGIRTQFRTIDEVQNMIKHLQKIEEDMKKNDGDGGLNDKKTFSVSFEELSLLDESEYAIDENETEWLTKVPGSKKMSAKDLEGDESFIDSGLLNVRHGLLNFVKSVLIEEKTNKFSTSPRYQQNAAISNNTFSRRQPSPLNTTVPLRGPSPPTVYHTYSPVRPAIAALTSQGSSEDSPVSSSSANRSSFEFLSPNAHKPIREERSDLDSNPYFSTPAVKYIDSRTYTRPKKNRMPLDTYSDHQELPVSPIKIVQPEMPVEHHADTFDMDTANHQNQNMNETFVANDEIAENHKLLEEAASPPRRVTRNLSYVIRRDSESPNNNSPAHPSENIENIAVDLNNTFVRTREGTYSPSPTGSNNSIHTSSMEELHNLARIQEQSLRMSSNSKMLVRKETHTVLRASEQSLRPVNKPPMESQIPGQPKLRIQSRIPALGAAGSRIRPPVNGATRRPITSGGIRRAPDWRDDGAY